MNDENPAVGEVEGIEIMPLRDVRRAVENGERIELKCENGSWTKAPAEFLERAGMYGFHVAVRRP